MANFFRSFRDVLKNPRWFRREAQDYERQLAEFQVPASKPAIQAMVEQLLEEHPELHLHDKIQAQGPGAVPALVWALQDPRFWKHKLGEGLSAMWPVERVLGILCFLNPPQAVEPATALLNHEDKAIRAAAARLLASIADDACAEPVAAALKDEEDDVCGRALMGIYKSIEAKRCTPAFLNAVFEPLGSLLTRPGRKQYVLAPDCLLAIDRLRAMSVMMSNRVLQAENDQLFQVLRAVNSAGERIPADKILPLLAALRPCIKDHWRRSAYAAALTTLARSGDPRAESIIRSDLTSKDGSIQLGVAEALVALKGALPPRECFSKGVRPEDYEGLTQPQRLCYCIHELSMEANNGGLAQYLFNSSGDHARDALAALETLKAIAAESMLQRAIALFGPAGPSSDQEERQGQLSRFSGQQDAEMDRLTAQFLEDPDNIEALSALYAADHPEHFRSKN